jgi:hypothetical protein
LTPAIIAGVAQYLARSPLLVRKATRVPEPVQVDVVREGGGLFSSFVDPVESQQQSTSTGGDRPFFAASCRILYRSDSWRMRRKAGTRLVIRQLPVSYPPMKTGYSRLQAIEEVGGACGASAHRREQHSFDAKRGSRFCDVNCHVATFSKNRNVTLDNFKLGGVETKTASITCRK